MIAVVDYGVGNLFSLMSALRFLDIECIVTNRKEDLVQAERLILPGVGAFGSASEKLKESGLFEFVKESARKKPLLGICLGMQLLFDKGFEHGEYEGLGLIPGIVRPLSSDIRPSLKVPHMGWNRLEIVKEDPISKYVSIGRWVYYVHGYYAKTDADYILGISEYDLFVPGLVRSSFGKIYGMQFHPEKSGKTGLHLLKAFSEI